MPLKKGCMIQCCHGRVSGMRQMVSQEVPCRWSTAGLLFQVMLRKGSAQSGDHWEATEGYRVSRKLYDVRVADIWGSSAQHQDETRAEVLRSCLRRPIQSNACGQGRIRDVGVRSDNRQDRFYSMRALWRNARDGACCPSPRQESQEQLRHKPRNTLLDVPLDRTCRVQTDKSSSARCTIGRC